MLPQLICHLAAQHCGPSASTSSRPGGTSRASSASILPSAKDPWVCLPPRPLDVSSPKRTRPQTDHHVLLVQRVVALVLFVVLCIVPLHNPLRCRPLRLPAKEEEATSFLPRFRRASAALLPSFRRASVTAPHVKHVTSTGSRGYHTRDTCFYDVICGHVVMRCAGGRRGVRYDPEEPRDL